MEYKIDYELWAIQCGAENGPSLCNEGEPSLQVCLALILS